MSEEKVYTFNEYVLGYDSGGYNDRSCLTISKILNDNMYVMSTLYDGSAEVISTMLDSLQQKVEQLEKERLQILNILNNQMDYREYIDIINTIDNILKKGETNGR